MSDQDDFMALAGRNADRIEELRALDKLRSAEKNEFDIRSAIQRFVNGTTKTDGSWTVVNLVEEAGIPRPTLYRYKRELKDFQYIAAAAPTSAGGAREQLRNLRKELAAEKKAGQEERKRHQHVEDVLINRIHALSLLVASAQGKHGVTTLFPDFVKNKNGDIDDEG